MLDFLIDKSMYDSADNEYRDFVIQANQFINLRVSIDFDYFFDLLLDYDDGTDSFARLIFDDFFVDRVGGDECISKARAVRDAIRSSVVIATISPVYEYILYCILDYFVDDWRINREDYSNKRKDIDKDSSNFLEQQFYSGFYDENQISLARTIQSYYQKNIEDENVEGVYDTCLYALEQPDYLFDDIDFLPENLDIYVEYYISSSGNKQGYEHVFGINLSEYTLMMHDIVLERFEEFQNSVVRKEQEQEKREDNLVKDVYKTLIHCQLSPIGINKSEDEITDIIKIQLDMKYDVRDQSRCGTSVSGKSAGRVDLSIWNEGMPLALIEAVKLSYLNKNEISKHISKLINKYDQVGCVSNYLLVYYSGKHFGDFWLKLHEYIAMNQVFPYEMVDLMELNENLDYADSNSLLVVLNRNSLNVKLYIMAMRIS